MKTDNPFLIGSVLFVLIVLTGLATSIVPVAETVPASEADFESLVTSTLVEGTGTREAESGDTLKVHYTGTLKDGTEFDSSKDRDPIEFTLGAGEVIEGWDEGIKGMKQGELRMLEIPSSLGYGERGSGTSIPANAGLIFQVELVEFVD